MQFRAWNCWLWERESILVLSERVTRITAVLTSSVVEFGPLSHSDMYVACVDLTENPSHVCYKAQSDAVSVYCVLCVFWGGAVECAEC
jgi:hypothetical protein